MPGKENNRISEIMISHHALIEALLHVFEDEVLANPEKAEIFFSEFEWELKKHFFTEEQAIFDISLEEDAEVSAIIKKLRYDHIVILDKLEKLAKDPLSAGQGKIEEIGRLLAVHRETEDKKLYPLLDKRLSEDQKKIVISRVNEIPLTK